MKVYNNIEYLQVNFDGATDKVYFPINSKVVGRKVDTIHFLVNGGNTPLPTGDYNSPFDGTACVSFDEAKKMYYDLVNDDKEILQHNVPVIGELTDAMNHVPIDSIVDWELSSIRYVGDPADLAGKCLIIYVAYDTNISDDDVLNPMQSVTINIPAGDKIKIEDYIDDYIIASGSRIKKIVSRNNPRKNGIVMPSAFFDLQDYDGRVLRMIPNKMLIGHLFLPMPISSNMQSMLLDDFNIDFSNSYAYNVQEPINLTFYY